MQIKMFAFSTLINPLLSWCDLSWIWLVLNLIPKHVNGGCGDDKNKKGDDDCWYELWYFWFIIGLFLCAVIIVGIVYCKQHVKHSRIRDLGRRANRQIVLPPAYTEPGHEPPSYNVAMARTDNLRVHHSVHQAPSRQHSGSRHNPVETMRVESVPPPYSPPPPDTLQISSQFQPEPTDVDLYYSSAFANRTSARTFFHHLPFGRNRTSATGSAFQEITLSRSSTGSSSVFTAPPPYEYPPTRPVSGLSPREGEFSATSRPLSTLQRTTLTIPTETGLLATRGNQSSRSSGPHPVAFSYNLNTNNTGSQTVPSATLPGSTFEEERSNNVHVAISSTSTTSNESTVIATTTATTTTALNIHTNARAQTAANPVTSVSRLPLSNRKQTTESNISSANPSAHRTKNSSINNSQVTGNGQGVIPAQASAARRLQNSESVADLSHPQNSSQNQSGSMNSHL